MQPQRYVPLRRLSDVPWIMSLQLISRMQFGSRPLHGRHPDAERWHRNQVHIPHPDRRPCHLRIVETGSENPLKRYNASCRTDLGHFNAWGPNPEWLRLLAIQHIRGYEL